MDLWLNLTTMDLFETEGQLRNQNINFINYEIKMKI